MSSSSSSSVIFLRISQITIQFHYINSLKIEVFATKEFSIEMIDFEFLNFCAFFLTSLESIRESFCVCGLQVWCNYLLQKQCLCLSGSKNLLLYCCERTEKSECWAEKVSHIHHFISSLNRFNKPFGCAVYKWRTIAYCKSSVFVRAGSKNLLLYCCEKLRKWVLSRKSLSSSSFIAWRCKYQ